MTIFYNYSSEPFTCTWDKIAYTFEPQKVYSGVLIANNKENSITLTESIAKVFAHHLAAFVMNSSKEWSKDAQKYTYGSMELLEQRALALPEEETPLPPALDELPAYGHKLAESPAVESPVSAAPAVAEEPKKKMGRPPKAKAGVPSPDAEFDV